MQQGRGCTPSQGQTLRTQMLSPDIILQTRSPGVQPGLKMPCQEDGLVGSKGHGWQGPTTVCRYMGWQAHGMSVHTFRIPEVWPGHRQHAVPIWLHPAI